MSEKDSASVLVSASGITPPSADEGGHPSVVRDQPGHPIAAPCAIEYCRYADLEARLAVVEADRDKLESFYPDELAAHLAAVEAEKTGLAWEVTKSAEAAMKAEAEAAHLRAGIAALRQSVAYLKSSLLSSTVGYPMINRDLVLDLISALLEQQSDFDAVARSEGSDHEPPPRAKSLSSEALRETLITRTIPEQMQRAQAEFQRLELLYAGADRSWRELLSDFLGFPVPDEWRARFGPMVQAAWSSSRPTP